MFPVLPKPIFAAALLLGVALWAASCAAPLGPGYTIERQGAAAGFVAGSDPKIEIHAEYRLRNTGNQPLGELAVRLPRESVVRLEGVSLRWDGKPGLYERRSDPEGDILHLKWNAPWPVKQRHTLNIDYYVVRGDRSTTQLDVAPDGFYLPMDGWLAVPLPPAGTFSRGGAPPKEWVLSVRVPAGFLVRAPGDLRRPEKSSRGGVIEFTQRAQGVAPYIVAGRYFEQEYHGSPCTVYIWKKNKFDRSEAEPLAAAVHKIAETYEAMFGPRDKIPRAIWIADSPVPANVYGFTTPFGMGEIEGLPYIPPDFVFLRNSAIADPARLREGILSDIAESLARTWTGFGLNPRYDRQLAPLNSLPSYAAWVAREALEGPRARTRAIRESLESYDFVQANTPAGSQEGAKKELGVFTDGFAFPPKTLLFYFALEDQFGRVHVHNALRYMVQARRGRGYNLDDLIAALAVETRQNAAEFVRLWRKHPGIPGEFRARYASRPAPAATSLQEMKP